MIQLELNLNEVNQILEALGHQPYKDVFQLVIKIQQQAGSQLNTENQTAAIKSEKTKTTQS